MTKPWADRPFDLIHTPTKDETKGISKETVHVATAMTLAHNMIVRGINAIYLQALGVTQPADITDFITFCKVTMEGIHHHHSIEERYLFPAIVEYTGKPDIMEGNIAQHHAFETGVDKFIKYLEEVTVESYDGKEVLEMLNEFGPALHMHLKEEIATLLALDEYGGKKLAKVWAAADKKVLEEMEDLHRTLPAGLGANDRTFEGGANASWPPIPFFLPYLVKYYYSKKHKGSWRFTACDMFGKPKPLEFAADE